MNRNPVNKTLTEKVLGIYLTKMDVSHTFVLLAYQQQQVFL